MALTPNGQNGISVSCEGGLFIIDGHMEDVSAPPTVPPIDPSQVTLRYDTTNDVTYVWDTADGEWIRVTGNVHSQGGGIAAYPELSASLPAAPVFNVPTNPKSGDTHIDVYRGDAVAGGGSMYWRHDGTSWVRLAGHNTLYGAAGASVTSLSSSHSGGLLTERFFPQLAFSYTLTSKNAALYLFNPGDSIWQQIGSTPRGANIIAGAPPVVANPNGPDVSTFQYDLANIQAQMLWDPTGQAWHWQQGWTRSTFHDEAGAAPGAPSAPTTIPSFVNHGDRVVENWSTDKILRFWTYNKETDTWSLDFEFSGGGTDTSITDGALPVALGNRVADFGGFDLTLQNAADIAIENIAGDAIYIGALGGISMYASAIMELDSSTAQYQFSTFPPLNSDAGSNILAMDTTGGFIGRYSENALRSLYGAGAPVDGVDTAYYAGQIYIDSVTGAMYRALTKSTDPDSAAAGSTWSILASTGAYATIVDGDTTPSIGVTNKLKTANSGPTIITAIDDMSDGDRAYLLVDDANTTLAHSATFFLAGQENYVVDSGTLLEFSSDGTVVREVGRRVFNIVDTGDIAWSVVGNDYEGVLTNTGVVAGTYDNASVTVDAKGRVTSILAGSPFDNEAPFVIDLDSPNVDDVVAMFISDNNATTETLQLFRGASKIWAVDSRGATQQNLIRYYSESAADINGWFDKMDNMLIIDSTTGMGTGNYGYSKTAQFRANVSPPSGRPMHGFVFKSTIPNTSLFPFGGTLNAGLKGTTISATHDSSTLVQPRVRGLLASAGQSRSGGTTTQVEVIEVQVTSSGAVTTGTGVKILAPSNPANVATSIGMDIEDMTTAIRTGAGAISFGGIVDYTGTLGNSTKDPTVDAPADWLEIKIAGTTYYIPAYTA